MNVHKCIIWFRLCGLRPVVISLGRRTEGTEHPKHRIPQWSCRGVQPGRKTLATGSHDQTGEIVGRGHGKERATLKRHALVSGTVAFSPDGKTLASAISGSPADPRNLLSNCGT